MSVRQIVTSCLLDPGHVWGRLVALVVPVAVLGVWLKMLRIRAFYPEGGAGDALARVASDVAFGAAWVLLWVVACWLTRGHTRVAVFYLAHIFTLVVGIFTVFNHEFVIRTGNPLTVAQMTYAWRNRAELSSLVESQVSDSAIQLLTGVVVGVVVLPPLVGPLLDRLVRARPGGRARRVLKGASLAGLTLLLALSAWSAPTVSAAFSLAAPVQLAVGQVREVLAYPSVPAGDESVPAPDTTRLVAREGADHKNLVVLTLESQRDATTLPETSEPVTPVLDALAASAIRPERGYTVFPHTSKALTAVTCGIAPPLDSENSEAEPGSLPGRCLPDLLSEHGYATAFFQSATENFERRRGTISNFGYQDFTPVDEMDPTGFKVANYFGYEDDIMLAPQRAWLMEHGGGPFMMGALTVTGHHDYSLAGFELIDFVDDPLLNNYLNGIHYQDQYVGHVIDMFKELGLYDNTIFIITGDHGEGFGEHRLYQHDNTIYEEGIRIPFLVIDPSREGSVVDGPANQLAVVPTAADLLGFELVSDTRYQPSLASGEDQGAVVATCYARGRCAATMTGDMKVIHHFGDRRDEVFNVALDPHEQEDLAVVTDRAWIREQRDVALQWYVEAERFYSLYRGQDR